MISHTWKKSPDAQRPSCAQTHPWSLVFVLVLPPAAGVGDRAVAEGDLSRLPVDRDVEGPGAAGGVRLRACVLQEHSSGRVRLTARQLRDTNT